jgi:TatD DNase family protein
MRLPLVPLDLHAHVETTIDPTMLRELRAVVVAVTREPREWNAALDRADPTTLWAIGVHPGVSAALSAFDATKFRSALARAVFVGEVGLDGRASTDRDLQRQVFDSVLDALGEHPRPVTIHSMSASDEVLAALCARPVAATILHWWRGSATQTREAVELGCFFSVNAHEVIKPRVLDLVPRERLLTETDFPHTRRYDRSATKPGMVETIEAHLEVRWETSRLEVRRQLWRNLGSLLTQTNIIDRMPRVVLAGLAAAGFES